MIYYQPANERMKWKLRDAAAAAADGGGQDEDEEQ